MPRGMNMEVYQLIYTNTVTYAQKMDVQVFVFKEICGPLLLAWYWHDPTFQKMV